MLKAPMPESVMAEVWMEHFQYIQQDLRAKEGIYGSKKKEMREKFQIFVIRPVFERILCEIGFKTENCPNAGQIDIFGSETEITI